MSQHLPPPPSIVDLIKDDIKSDTIWKKWLHKLYTKVISSSYANVYAHENTTATVISTINTWYQVTILTNNGPSSNLIPDYTNDHITVDEDGDYKIDVAVSIDGVGGGGDSYDVTVFLNNGTTEVHHVHASTYLLGGSKNDESMACMGITTLSKDDTVELWIKNVTGTNNVIVTDVSLSVVKMNH